MDEQDDTNKIEDCEPTVFIRDEAPKSCDSRCYSCNYTSDGKVYNPKPNFWKLINNNKKIQNVVGVKQSLYLSDLSSLNVYIGSRCNTTRVPNCPQNLQPIFGAGTWNQSSDRIFPSRSRINYTYNNVPSRGNSIKSSITKMRPGSSCPGGKGVDVKHNSYARYIARIKGKNIKSKYNLSRSSFNTAINNVNQQNKSVNNKPLPLMIVNQSSRDSLVFNGNICSCLI